jgi:hypothetical protein
MASTDRVVVKSAGLDSEDIYFKEQEQKRIKELRERTGKQADRQYAEDHKYHCFRCGTPSLVEVQYGDVTVDVCVNKTCGAVHLDPGEMEAMSTKSAGAINKVRKAVLGIFG